MKFPNIVNALFFIKSSNLMITFLGFRVMNGDMVKSEVCGIRDNT